MDGKNSNIDHDANSLLNSRSNAHKQEATAAPDTLTFHTVAKRDDGSTRWQQQLQQPHQTRHFSYDEGTSWFGDHDILRLMVAQTSNYGNVTLNTVATAIALAHLDRPG